MAPRIFLYEYIIFPHLSIWLPGSAAGRLCEYRLIEPACSCSESVLIEPVAHFHSCSCRLGFTRGIDGLVAPSLAACDSLFEPAVDVPALEGVTRLCHLCCRTGAVTFLLLGGRLFAANFSASRYSLASLVLTILLEVDCISPCAQHCPPFLSPAPFYRSTHGYCLREQFRDFIVP